MSWLNWQVTDLPSGLRYDSFISWIPQQTTPTAPAGSHKTKNKVQVLTFNNVYVFAHIHTNTEIQLACFIVYIIYNQYVNQYSGGWEPAAFRGWRLLQYLFCPQGMRIDGVHLRVGYIWHLVINVMMSLVLCRVTGLWGITESYQISVWMQMRKKRVLHIGSYPLTYD